MKSPFEILELKPFLYVSPADQQKLKAHHLKLARQFHPDRCLNSSEEEKKAAEERSSEINRAAREILDPWARVESLFRMEEIPVNSHKESQIPDLAMEYFQVQEEIEDRPSEQESIRNAFLEKLNLELLRHQDTLENLSKPYSFGVPSDWPPPRELTQRLLELYQRRNYIKRMIENLSPDSRGLL